MLYVIGYVALQRCCSRGCRHVGGHRSWSGSMWVEAATCPQPPLAPRQWRDSVPAAKMPPKVWAASFTAFVEIFNFQLSPSLLNAINCIFQSLQFAADLCFPTNLSASLSLSRFISKWRRAAQNRNSHKITLLEQNKLCQSNLTPLNKTFCFWLCIDWMFFLL